MSNNIFLLEDMHHGAVAKKTSVVLPPTQVAAQQNVFAEAMLEAASPTKKAPAEMGSVTGGARRGPDAASPAATLFLTGIGSAPIQYHAADGASAACRRSTTSSTGQPRAWFTPCRNITPGRLTAPSFVPKTVAVAAPADSAPPEVAFAGVPGGVPGGIAGGQVGGILGSMGPAAPTPVAAVSEGPRAPVRIGGDVKPPRLVSGPAPVYPMIARQAHIQGTVVIDAIIDEHGNVIQERALSGPPLLIQAAMQAVSQRKYEPTVLDGQATPVDLRIEVNFHTGG